jgi:hypothetical protein
MLGMVKWNGSSASLRRLEQALERERPSPALLAVKESALVKTPNAGLPPRVDLLRVCAQHGGNPWAAVYLLNASGGYEYSASIAITKTLSRTQYAPAVANTVIWDNTWIDEESCALCGVPSRGPVRCGACRQLVCRGRSTGQYFRCCCGAEGWIKTEGIEHLGVIPRTAG